MKHPYITPGRAQEIQDMIFDTMTDEKKIELWAKLWLLGKSLNPKNFGYGRSTRASRQNRSDS